MYIYLYSWYKKKKKKKKKKKYLFGGQFININCIYVFVVILNEINLFVLLAIFETILKHATINFLFSH